MASASASALIMNNHKNSINYVPTVASCLTPPMANSIASLGKGKGGRGEASTVGAELNGMQKCKSKIIYASLLTAVAVGLRRIASACCGHKNLAQLSPLSPFLHSTLFVCLSISFRIAFRIALCFVPERGHNCCQCWSNKMASSLDCSLVAWALWLVWFVCSGRRAGSRGERECSTLHLHSWLGIIHYQAFCRLPRRVMRPDRGQTETPHTSVTCTTRRGQLILQLLV